MILILWVQERRFCNIQVLQAEYLGMRCHCVCATHIQKFNKGFPGGAVVKNPPANAGDTGLIPGPGRSHMPRSN